MLNKLKKIAKDLLAIRSIRRVYENTNRAFLETFGSSRILSHFFFLVSFITFNREQAATLQGRRDYYRNKKRDRLTRVELRRNVHRIEKGLIMRPRRDVFARDYVGETIEFYAAAASQCKRSPGTSEIAEMDWAHNVLEEYFRVSATGKDKVVDEARRTFESIDYVPSTTGNVPRAKQLTSNVSYDELVDLANQRRSVRFFDDKPVPRDLVDKALMVARQAPTACNRLPYEFRVFDDPAMVKKVSNIPFGTAGYADNIQTVIVVVGKLESYFSPRDRHAIYVDASLASMSFMFGLETLGLSSSVINWPDFEPLERKMQKTLGLSGSDRVIMLIAVGYAHPDGLVPFSQKKELDTFRSYNNLAR
ncbi:MULTISPECIES: nitroreductase family protein [unclassified Frondihabitans]|uniref:nitroreductase family protein n=1 Tax=unclassified Frondihabitans TaxID=2626248 RepID=UPI000F4E153F|nr:MULTISPECIES: nitroreductase family protein [unclassified Frondihabitans]RPE79059.1 nitroreductase [Frondihabitans sp. PhB153]RPF09339.1 nitroreductase [Frondihabitans sp. PhB161]